MNKVNPFKLIQGRQLQQYAQVSINSYMRNIFLARYICHPNIIKTSQRVNTL